MGLIHRRERAHGERLEGASRRYFSRSCRSCGCVPSPIARLRFGEADGEEECTQLVHAVGLAALLPLERLGPRSPAERKIHRRGVLKTSTCGLLRLTIVLGARDRVNATGLGRLTQRQEQRAVRRAQSSTTSRSTKRASTAETLDEDVDIVTDESIGRRYFAARAADRDALLTGRSATPSTLGYARDLGPAYSFVGRSSCHRRCRAALPFGRRA